MAKAIEPIPPRMIVVYAIMPGIVVNANTPTMPNPIDVKKATPIDL